MNAAPGLLWGVLCLSGLLILAASAPARAEPCLDLLEKPHDAAACIGRTTKASEAEMATAQQAVQAAIDAKPGSASLRRRLRQDFTSSQQRWSSFAKAQCSLVGDAAKGGKDEPYAEMLCRRELTDARTRDLQALARRLR